MYIQRLSINLHPHDCDHVRDVAFFVSKNEEREEGNGREREREKERGREERVGGGG